MADSRYYAAATAGDAGAYQETEVADTDADSLVTEPDAPAGIAEPAAGGGEVLPDEAICHIPHEGGPPAPGRIAVPARAFPHGNLERVGHDEIAGWAWDSERPDESVDIEILVALRAVGGLVPSSRAICRLRASVKESTMAGVHSMD